MIEFDQLQSRFFYNERGVLIKLYYIVLYSIIIKAVTFDFLLDAFFYVFFEQMQVMDNKMFSVEPKNGLLSPGQLCTVGLIYK